MSADGRRIRAGDLWCTFVADPTLTPPRVAFALGRALGPAVVRNRLRRRLRALLSAAPPPPGLYLVGARPDVVARSFAELQFDLGRLLRQVPSTAAMTTMTTTTTSSAMLQPHAAVSPGS